MNTKRIGIIVLMCPLTAVAADWSYDGQAAAPGPSSVVVEQQAGRSAGPAPADAPRGSMTMEQVRAAKGEPETVFPAVGEPPITRWQYPKYVVYFENERVITSVAGHW
ncbi:MAG TPA: hypothetical protein VK973_09040 [Arenicellales bacterium]|nr:hypothetical protein [Arenicellales bacterium]